MSRRAGKITMTLSTAVTPPGRRSVADFAPAAATRSWFRVYNVGSGVPTNDATRVDIYEEIGGWGVSAAEFVQALRAIATPHVHLHVNSPGGSVFDGVAIFNALAQHPARVTAYVDGLAASAASFIVQAADEVVMNPGSMMMVHDAIGMTWGNAFDHTTMAEMLGQVSDSIADLYAVRAGGTAADWRAVMQKDGGEGQWYTAEQAVEAGLADRVHGAAPTAEEQAATGQPDPADEPLVEPQDQINRYESSSIAAGHRLVLAQRDEALRLAPPPVRPASPAQQQRTIDGAGALAFWERQAPTAPFDLAALAETMAAVERQPYTEDPFIPFQ